MNETTIVIAILSIAFAALILAIHNEKRREGQMRQAVEELAFPTRAHERRLMQEAMDRMCHLEYEVPPARHYDDSVDAARYAYMAVSTPQMTPSTSMPSIIEDYSRQIFPYQSFAAANKARWQQAELDIRLAHLKAKASEPSTCSYCGSEWHPNRFHPGSCDECGAPRRNA